MPRRQAAAAPSGPSAGSAAREGGPRSRPAGRLGGEGCRPLLRHCKLHLDVRQLLPRRPGVLGGGAVRNAQLVGQARIRRREVAAALDIGLRRRPQVRHQLLQGIRSAYPPP